MVNVNMFCWYVRVSARAFFAHFNFAIRTLQHGIRTTIWNVNIKRNIVVFSSQCPAYTPNTLVPEHSGVGRRLKIDPPAIHFHIVLEWSW